MKLYFPFIASIMLLPTSCYRTEPCAAFPEEILSYFPAIESAVFVNNHNDSIVWKSENLCVRHQVHREWGSTDMCVTDMLYQYQDFSLNNTLLCNAMICGGQGVNPPIERLNRLYLNITYEASGHPQYVERSFAVAFDSEGRLTEAPFQDTICILRNPGSGETLDSVVIVKHLGIISFYDHSTETQWVLQQNEQKK